MKTKTPIFPENFKKLVAERIGDPQLRANLKRASLTSLEKRAEVVADYDNWETMRSVAHDIKRHVIGRLPEYLETFERNAIANGANIIYARDGKEARESILRIVKRANGAVLVKSKSMTTEEIGLTHELIRHGIDAVETDLGEYIVQLAHELPSHITAPALHKSREQIGRLFERELNVPYTQEPAVLTAIARKVLREKFLRAGVGISGVNFAIAETGSICIVENEGNARLSTTLPKIHIALMSIEKILPDHQCLAHFLNMLGRSATGQRMTCYTSIITGPKQQGEIDGPDELHIVIMDNGRTKLLSDEKLREALLCIRCGACMNVCPVYEKIGGHSYGSIYPGPIGSVITPVFDGLDRAKALPYASSLCGACAEICPVKIDLHHLLLYHRQKIVERKYSPLFERILMMKFGFIMNHLFAYRFSGKAGALIGRLFKDKKGSLEIPIWSKTRDFPPPAEKTFKDLWKRR